MLTNKHVQAAGGSVRDSQRRRGVTPEHLQCPHQRRRSVQVCGKQQGGVGRTRGQTERVRLAVCTTYGQEGHCCRRDAGRHLSRCWLPY